jgi:hypothetical protein
MNHDVGLYRLGLPKLLQRSTISYSLTIAHLTVGRAMSMMMSRSPRNANPLPLEQSSRTQHNQVKHETLPSFKKNQRSLHRVRY